EKLGAEEPDTASTLSNFGLLYSSIGDYEKAEDLIKRSLKIREKIFGLDNNDTATSMSNLALVYFNKGDYSSSEPLFKKALEIKEKIFGSEHPETATSFNILASFYSSISEYRKAEPLLKKALEVREKVLGAEHPDTATTLNNLALLYSNIGEYNKAEPILKKALNIREKVLGLNHPITATTVNNLANLYSELGDYEKAEELYKRSLEIREKALGAEHPSTALSLNNLGLFYFNQKNSEKAEQFLKRALEIREKLLGLEHPDTATILNILGGLYYSKKEYDKSESFLKRSLQIREKVLGSMSVETGTTLNNLGNFYHRQKDYEKAEPYYLKALAIYEKMLGEEHPSTATIFNNLSSLYRIKGDLEKAVLYRVKANEVREREYARNLVAGSEKQKLLYLKKTSSELSATVSLHLQSLPEDREAAKTALTEILRRKGRALDAMASVIEVLRQRASEEDRLLLSDVAEAKSVLSRIVLKGPGKESIEKYKEKIKDLEEKAEELENRLSAKSKEYRAQVQEVNLDLVREAIPEGGVLLEYVSYQPYDAKEEAFEKVGNRRYAVYSLSSEGKIEWADLGEAEKIDQLVAEVRKKLRDKKVMRREVEVTTRKLYKKLIKPVLEKIGKRERLLISPDGSLNLIPYAALMDERGKYLIEKFNLSYLTSGRDLLRLQIKTAATEPAIVVADPDYEEGEGPKLAGMQYNPLKRLKATAEEGKQVKAMFEGAKLETEKEATEEKIKSIHRPEILHIATHGYFLEETKGRSEQRGEETRLLLQQADEKVDVEKVKLENPLLRSWLFFAGANRGGDSGNDGTMTALEAASLDLWGTKLVVLSACDTGLGEVKSGEGVYGMRRALVLAGSESQMISLWPVSDKATKELMIDYYKRLKVGEGRGDALRSVQLKMLKDAKRNHPFYWASFI
ncbi:MAG: CHAT domain-containing protein, partial [Blastocatellia bacterium]|nr:CHAT domain-containing protein [Blastocatellia bacterium]